MKEVYDFSKPFGRWMELFHEDNERLQDICSRTSFGGPILIINQIYPIVYGKERP